MKTIIVSELTYRRWFLEASKEFLIGDYEDYSLEFNIKPGTMLDDGSVEIVISDEHFDQLEAFRQSHNLPDMEHVIMASIRTVQKARAAS